jgi:pSer/pThr/pTyr-binding forkhead associated (FHA) protein
MLLPGAVTPEPREVPKFWLLRARWVIPLREGTIVLGRANDCDVVLVDARVSRRHARIDVEGDSVWVDDLGSRRGTWLAGRRVTEKQRMWPDEELQLGNTRLVLQFAGSAACGPPSSRPPSGKGAVLSPELRELTTVRAIDWERGLLDAACAFDEGRVSESQALLQEYMALLDAAPDHVAPRLVTQTAFLALRMAVSLHDTELAGWVSTLQRRTGFEMTGEMTRLAREASAEC